MSPVTPINIKRKRDDQLWIAEGIGVYLQTTLPQTHPVIYIYTIIFSFGHHQSVLGNENLPDHKRKWNTRPQIDISHINFHAWYTSSLVPRPESLGTRLCQEFISMEVFVAGMLNTISSWATSNKIDCLATVAHCSHSQERGENKHPNFSTDWHLVSLI